MQVFESLTFISAFSCFIFASAHGKITSEGPRVKLSTGEIEGYNLTTSSGASARVFLGIPHVEPPLGDLRFANPVPKSPWTGTLMCKEYKHACPLNSTTSRTHFNVTDEDCLYVNVFAGINCNIRNPCPVLIYIHGGGYEFDSPSQFLPEVWVENFASQDIVVVTPGYRLGVLGFWSTGTDEALGNWAMHDMIEGVKWVQKEIRNFGGDPTKMTSMGHSSSAMAISLLTMSPTTEGLFEHVIIMSGTSCQDSSMSNDLSNYQNLTIKLNCATESDWKRKKNLGQMVDCMRQFDGQFLVNQFNEVRENITGAGKLHHVSYFSVLSVDPLEKNSHMTVPRNDGPFGLFPKPLQQLIKERRPVTMMTGTTKNEAGQLKMVFANATGLTVASVCGAIVDEAAYKNPKEVKMQCIREYVLDALPYSSEIVSGNYSFWAEQAETVYEDVGYYSPCHREVTSVASKGGTIYLYSFDYEKAGQEGYTPYHSFDLVYINGLHMFEFDERDKEIQARYLPLFVNFVKYSNPTPEPVDEGKWQPLGYPFGSFRYLSVDLPTKMKPDYHRKGVIFWNQKVPAIEIGSSSPRVEENSIQFDGETKITTVVGVGVFLLVALIIIVYQLVAKRYQTRKVENILLEKKQPNYETI